MDIICARCGRHFNSIEGAREHNREDCDRIASFGRLLGETTASRITKKPHSSVFDSIIWDMGVETVDEAVERHKRVAENISEDSKIVDDHPPPNPIKDSLDEKDAQRWRKRHWWWRFHHGKGTLFK